MEEAGREQAGTESGRRVSGCGCLVAALMLPALWALAFASPLLGHSVSRWIATCVALGVVVSVAQLLLLIAGDEGLPLRPSELAGLLLILGVVSLFAWADRGRKAAWPVVTGTLLSVELGPRQRRVHLEYTENVWPLSVSYRYWAKGRWRVGETCECVGIDEYPTEAAARRRARALERSRQVQVRHDPDDPDRSCLYLEAGGENDLKAIAALFAGSLAWLILAAVLPRRPPAVAASDPPPADEPVEE